MSMSAAAEFTRTDWSLVAADLIRARQTVLPKRLAAPGPDDAQFLAMLEAAAAAPDHGQLLPWRFVAVPDSRRAELGEVFAQALAERDADATPEQREQAREKAFRSPRLLLLVVDAARGDPEVDLAERLISAGCCGSEHVAGGHRAGLRLGAHQRQGAEVGGAARAASP